LCRVAPYRETVEALRRWPANCDRERCPVAIEPSRVHDLSDLADHIRPLWILRTWMLVVIDQASIHGEVERVYLILKVEVFYLNPSTIRAGLVQNGVNQVEKGSPAPEVGIRVRGLVTGIDSLAVRVTRIAVFRKPNGTHFKNLNLIP
jgi:hypothetical protein